MSGRHERALAKLLSEQMDKRDSKDTNGRIRLAEVVTVDPMSLRPMGGLIALPSDAMLWTNIAKATRDDWNVGDTVVIASQQGMYVVIDLLDVGEVLPVGGAGSGGTLDELTDVALAAVATGDLLMKGLTGWVNGKLTDANVHTDNVDGAAGTASLRTLGTGAAQAAAGNHTHATLPSTQEKDALAGTTGTPSSTNKYVTNSDTRMTDARTPLAHTHPQSDVTNLVTDLSNKQPLDSDLTAIAAIAPTNDDIIQRKAGAWVNRSMAQLATDLGLAASYQPLDSDLTTIAALSPSNDTIMQRKAGAWVASTPATVKTDLALVKGDVGLGNVDNTSDANKPVSTATQTALNLKANLASPTFTGTVTVPNVAIGAGTSAATIGAVNTALGAYLTTAAAAAAYQPLDADLTTIAGLTATTDSFMQAKAGAWSARTIAQVITDLAAGGLLTSAAAAAAYQPLDSDLTAIAAIAPTNDDIIQRKAGAWINRTPAQFKTDLVLVKGDVGLGNVDNTSDANKPVSTATQTALDLKANLASPTFTGTVTVPNVAIGAGTSAATIGAVNTALASYLTTAAAAAAYQPLDSDLTAIAAIAPTNDDIVQRKAGAWVNRTMAQLKTDLAIVPGDISGFDTQVRTNRLDQMAAPTAAVSMGSQRITSVADATAATDAVNRQFGDARFAALSHSHTLDSLSDVDTTGVGSGYVLSHNGTSWVVAAPGAPGAHASTHVRGATDEIDGDILDIDWNPSNSTPAIVAETSHIDHLSSHLKGIDDAIALKFAKTGGTITGNVLISNGALPTTAGDAVLELAGGTHGAQLLFTNEVTEEEYALKTDESTEDFSLENTTEGRTLFRAQDGPSGTFDILPGDAATTLNAKVAGKTIWHAGNHGDGAVPVGIIRDFAGISLPSKHLWADGSYVDRTTYALLFAALTVNKGATTVTLASPGVFTKVAHGLEIGDAVFLTTTGALPTGMAANTTYYVMTVPTADTFTLGTTRTISALTNATVVSTAVNTSVSQSGVHTLYHAPYGVPAGDASNFYLPDARGRVMVGIDNMNNSVGTGGGDASRLTINNNIGGFAGEEFHTLTLAESAAHDHGGATGGNTANFTSNVTSNGSTATFSTAVTTGNESASHTHDVGYGTISNTTTGGAGARVTALGGGSTYTTSGRSVTHTHDASAAALNAAQSNHTHVVTAANLNAAQTNHTHTISSAGGGGSHNTMSPYLIVNKIIYAGV